MQPKDITNHILLEYGEPTIRRNFGLTYTKYSPGLIPGWKIASLLARSGLLETQLTSTPSTTKEWEKVAIQEGIPLQGFTAPSITEFLEALPRKARLSEITYDQDFTSTLTKVLECYSINTPGKSTVYPLLDGPPGASKSIVVMVAAALLGLPVYTVTGSDGAADEIKITLLGGDNANADTLLGLVKKYVYQGWIKSPLSLKTLAIAFEKYTYLDAIPERILLEIATYENIRENITSYSPGAYQLASKHGGILFLDELNGFKGVTTVLTEILENYTVEQHPNFFIIGALNPSGAKHDRDPLPPEIRSRMTTIYVKPPTSDSYYQMLQYAFTGIQPTITLPNGQKGKVTPSITGFSIPPKAPGLLSKSLIPTSLNEFLNNYAKAHKLIETKYEDGTLDPRDVADPQTNETTSVDRRMLVRGINSIETYLSMSDIELTAGELPYEQYNEDKIYNSTQIAEAVSKMFERIYLDSFNFPINESVDNDKKKTITYSSAKEIVLAILEANKLTHPQLLKYLKTEVDEKLLIEEWSKILSKYDVKSKSDIKRIVRKAKEYDLEPKSKSYSIIKTSEGTPELLHLQYMANKDDIKTYTGKNYPQLTLESSNSASFFTIAETRIKMLKENGSFTKRFLTKSEYLAAEEYISKLRSKDLDAIYFSLISVPDVDMDDSLSMIVSVPLFCFKDQIQEKLKEQNKVSLPLMTRLAKIKQNGTVHKVDTGSLILLLSRIFAQMNDNTPLVLNKVSRIIPLDFTIDIHN